MHILTDSETAGKHSKRKQIVINNMEVEKDISDEIADVLRSSGFVSQDSSTNDTGLEHGFVHDTTFLEKRRVGRYTLLQNLGSGSSSKVKLGMDTQNEERVAIKIVPRKNVNPAIAKERQDKRDRRIYREILITSLLNHPHIVRLIDFLHSETHFFLISEYAKGSQLFDIILENGPMKEKDARRIFRQILSAVDYIHRNSIVHRDLKIENILVDENGNAKIIDFGLSNFYDNKQLLTTFCGSLYFAAPELLLGHRYCGPEIDIWSLGVILYVMVCGTVPFDDKDMNTLQTKIKSAKYTFPSFVSDQAKNLISCMILAEPASRYGLEQVIRDVWVNEDFDTKVDNYMNKRYPITALNEELVRALEGVATTQFPDFKKDLLRFVETCRRETGTLEQIYWGRRPSVSLYYLLMECCGIKKGSSYVKSGACAYPQDASDNVCETPERVHTFVRFLFRKVKEGNAGRYYTKSIFVGGSATAGRKRRTETLEDDRRCDVEDHPKLRKSVVQGIFRGVCLKGMLQHIQAKEVVVNFLLRNKISYETNKKNYFCTIRNKRNVCHFKLSLFYNIVLRRFVLSFKHLNGDTEVLAKTKKLFINNLKNTKPE